MNSMIYANGGDGSFSGLNNVAWGTMGAVGVNWNQISPRWGYQNSGPFYPR